MTSRIKTAQLFKTFLFLLAILLIVSGRDFFSNFINRDSPDSISSTATIIKDYCLENAGISKGKENCYGEEFKKLAEQNGPEFSFKVLDSLHKMDPDSIGCHLIAHGIGWGSYKKEPSNWRTLVQNMPTICSYGGIHGVIESYILSLPDKSLNREVIPTICGEAPRGNCNHIVGHLLLVQTEADVDKALDLCSVFTSSVQRNLCIPGVFMENETALNLVAHDLVPKSWFNWSLRFEELEKLCRSYAGEFAEGCWQELSHVILYKFNNDPKKTFDFCATAQVPNGAKKCKKHALQIIATLRSFDFANLEYICSIPQKDDPTFENGCYSALIASALYTTPSKVPEAVSFCNSLGKEFQQSCFSMIGSISFSIPIVGEITVDACKTAPEEFRNYCLGVSRSNNQDQYIRSDD